VHVPKGYVYFAMAFSAFVEFLNYRLRRAKQAAKSDSKPESAH
ncbi:MAG: TerC family protein, partial [Planctomycetota bacterium]